ncbi:MAG: excinuclease ABC subunit UvrA [Candidatus Buchananbacteria bacterium]|nr:excinuclease ABC subunit UvrA [Candidatus Buchananbacteria bacterium]
MANNKKQYIKIKGARQHNLKNINVDIPIDKLTVITGLSGSGKSTLAFDTLYAEGQRRYVESLSAYARQFLGLMNKPDVDSISGLSPAISIEQKSVSKNPRSTVGTITEIADYLRLLYARVGTPHCPNCGKKISFQSVESIVKNLLSLKKGAKLQILAPVVRAKKGTYEQLLKDWHNQGYARVRVDGQVYQLADWQTIKLNKQIKHNLEIIIDRLPVETKNKSRLNEAVETAVNLADGLVLVLIDEKEKMFSQANACTDCDISIGELQPRMFSFNSPFGACEACHGLGFSQEFDEDLIVPDKSLSVAQGAVKPWRSYGEGWRYQHLESLAQHYKFDLNLAWNDLPRNIKDIILFGSDKQMKFEIGSRSGNSSYQYVGTFEGVIPQLDRLYKQTESEYRRNEIAKFMRMGPCPACQGKRFRPEILAVTLGNKKIKTKKEVDNGYNIWEVAEMSIEQLVAFFKSLKLNTEQLAIANLILKEITNRLNFLINVGLDYLTLNRPAGSLSGGEAQRIRLATQIGSELRGVLYILDEPSIGLHQRDNQKLIATLKQLRDLGNTVVVVEHDEETILEADHVVDLGPGAGRHGGELIFAGTPKQLASAKNSLTSQYISGKKKIAIPENRRRIFDWLEIFGAEQHNLKNIDVKIPLKVLTCVTGVSGSGKSTLIDDILYRALHKIFYATSERPGQHKNIKGYGKLEKVIMVDQSPIGRTPRSNPATYIGVFTQIRELFSSTKEARARGYKPGRFSFNVSGGRCEECEGDGVKKIEMNFLPDVYIECQRCKGTRYNEETLSIKYKNRTIADVLKMTVEEALEFFKNVPAIAHKMQTLFDVGLDYIQLGQSATTLSGGEAQRIKLTSELSRKAGNALYILDEPTTGLHFDDVSRLVEVFNRLVDKGNSVLVIEHNLDVIKSADWIVDLGLEGGDKGGRVVAEGTPEKIAKCAKWSYTGKYLSVVLKK